MMFLNNNNNKENIEPLPANKNEDVIPLPTRHKRTENVTPPNGVSKIESIDFSAPKITYSPRHQRRDSEGSGSRTTTLKGIAPSTLNKRRKNHTPKSKSPVSIQTDKESEDKEDDEKTPTSDPAFKEKTWLEELFEYYDFTDIREEFCTAATEALNKQILEGGKNDTLTETNKEEDQKLLDEEHFIDTEYDF